MSGVYLDFAATCPLSSIWVNSIVNSYSKKLIGNPGSYHSEGFIAKDCITESTKNILKNIFNDKLTSMDWNICYNSGSTESINQFIYAFSNDENIIIYENIAHKAILESVKKYSKLSFELNMGLSIDKNIDNFIGYINDLKHNNIKYKDIILVLTSVNNETGDIFDIDAIYNKIYKCIDYYLNNKVFLFIDHTQGFMKNEFKIPDYTSAFCFSAHKIGGMKGFGGLVYKKNIEKFLRDKPLIVGGYDIRGGTKDPINVKALDELIKDKTENSIINSYKVKELNIIIKDKLNEIANEFNLDLKFNFKSNKVSNYIINASFIGIEGESIMSSLIDDCISTGSACNSSNLETSHVLTGLNIPKIQANCAFRISISEEVTKDDINEFFKRFKKSINFLSKMRVRK